MREMKNWDHEPGQINNDSIDNLIKIKPDASIGDLVHGVPSEELNSEKTEKLQYEEDQLTLEIIKLQIELEKITSAIPEPNIDAKTEIEQMQASLSGKKERLLEVNKTITKHGELRNK